MALSLLASVLVSVPTHTEAFDRMAGALSGTVSSGGVREAVVLAEAACRPAPELLPRLLDALAAELAGRGLQREAVQAEEEAIKRASSDNIEQYSRRLESYRGLLE